MKPPPPPAQKMAQIIGFLLVGGLNFLLTYALYLVLLFVLSPLWSYVIATLCGIVFVIVMNVKKVFRKAITSRNFISLFLYNLAYSGISLAFLHALQTYSALWPAFYPLIIQAVLFPAHFLATRFLSSLSSKQA